jgi:S1-C subfamily serine protease
LAKIVSPIPFGQAWGRLAWGLGCIYSEGLAWDQGDGRVNLKIFEQPIRSELKREGYDISGDVADPFKEEKDAEIAIAGVITHIHGDFCQARFVDGTYGSASMDVEWQIYSKIDRKVIATVHSTGSRKSDTAATGGFASLLIGAMVENVRILAASDQFKTIVTAPQAENAQNVSKDKPPIALAGAISAQPLHIPDAVGSGFLVSSDGYVMTAQHVVGTDKYVKVRWSDGLEGVGEVVRSDKRRDVALVKVDPRGRQPLAMRRSQPEPGDTVFAIGAPLDEKLQSTVTRGVASANRIVDGFSFIQSDVTVNPGNSGGPLLDEQGRVLGLTDWGVRERNEANTGLNFFVPINDALLFLGAEPH